MNIESGIPAPSGKFGPRTEASKAAHKIKVGESVYCKDRAEYDTFRRVLYALGGKCLSRREGAGWRVWRKI